MSSSLLKAALENNTTVDQEEPQATPITTSEPVSVDDAFSDMELPEAAQDQAVSEYVEAVNSVDELDGLVAAIEPAEGQEVDVNQTGERILAVAVEQICDRLNIEMPQFISLESDDANGGFKKKFEQFKAFIVRVWESIVSSFKNVYEAIKNYIATSFNAAARVEKHAYELLTNGRKLVGTPSSSTYSSKDMSRRLAGDDKVGLIALFDRTLDLTDITVQAMYAEPARITTDLINSYVKEFTDGKKQSSARTLEMIADNLIAKISRAYAGRLLTEDKSPVAVNAPEGVKVYTSDVMMGNQVAMLSVPESVQDFKYFSFRIYSLDEESSESSDVPVSDAREQDQLLKMVIHNCGQIRRFGKSLKDLDAMNVALNKSLAELKSMQAKGDNDNSVEARKVIRLIAAAAPRIAQGIHGRTFAYSLNCCRAILKHVENCQSLYKEAA